MIDKKQVARNTLFMYIRMILVTIVSLYTSRVILNTLGVDNFGTYQVVGGVVSLLAFLNITLSQGSSRFLMFDLGKGDMAELKHTFSTLLTAHIGLAILVVIAAETLGIWLVKSKLVIAEDRMTAALITYQISVFTSFFTLTQAPYTATIKSHEKMDLYAYTAIVDVISKLLIAFLIAVSPIDKLVFYSSLLAIQTLAMNFFYRWYCVRHFEETKYSFYFDKDKFRSIISYSGWNFFSNFSSVANAQGMIIIINMFFNAGVVTAMSIATTVKNAANTFVENFIVAITPQVVKSYAHGDYEDSKKLLLRGTEYSYYLILAIGLPILLLAPEVLRLWLGFIPEYSVSFLRIIMSTCMIQAFSYCLFVAIDAAGKIKEYSIVNPIIMLVALPVTYLAFRFGASPVISAIVIMCGCSLISFVVLPFLDVKIVHYPSREIIRLFSKSLLITCVSFPIPLLAYIYSPLLHDFIKIIYITVVCEVLVGTTVWFLGLDKGIRMRVIQLVKNKIRRN